jgi:hypothetical protein
MTVFQKPLMAMEEGMDDEAFLPSPAGSDECR